MKKFLILSTMFILVATTAVGCQQSTPVAQDEMDNTSISQGIFEDGTHRAELEADERGWKASVEIIVENGNIISVDYDEFNEEGNRKSDDEAYGERMESATGITPQAAFEQLQESLLTTQDIAIIDSVSGATASREKFQKVVKVALSLDTEDVISLEDGIYTAATEADERGWKSVIEITVENGVIVSVDYDEFNEEGNRKSADEGYGERMADATSITPAEAFAALEASVIENQDVEAVEIVTGATSSSEKFSKLLIEALGL